MLSIGNPPLGYDLALSTSRLIGIVEYNPADLTVIARAGTTMAELERELRENGQFLPLDPPLPDRATIGGVLASNASGRWRTAYGSARDMVIGMRVALPSGQVAKSGGRVVKNVAGYDLAKLFIGSFGSLGVIVEAALKIYPLPAATHTLVVPAGELPAAFQTARFLAEIGPGVLTVAVVNEALGLSLGLPGVATVVTVGGTARAAQELVERIRAGAQGNVRTVREEEEAALTGALRDFPASADLKVSTVPTASGEAFALQQIREGLSYPAVGLSYLRVGDLTDEAVSAYRARLAKVRGAAILLRGDVDLKRTADAWGSAGPQIELMRKVKDVFDPERVVSPGRFVGGL